MILPGSIVGPDWLILHRTDPGLRIADVRSLGGSHLNRMAFEAGHIPKAIFFDMETDLSRPGGEGGRHPLPPVEEFAAVLGERGIGNEHAVVVYDDTYGAAAARLWWMLRYLGHDEVAVLDGGLAAWVADGGPVTKDVVDHERAEFVARPRPELVISREELRQRLGDVVLVDARAPERYSGEQEPLDPVAGHIPTAINLPFTANLDQAGRFRHEDALREIYADIGDGEVVAYCGSGVTACHTLLGMEQAGMEGGKLYVGSWSDWVTAPGEYPRAMGSDPGDAE